MKSRPPSDAQSLSVKRAEVEFHNFASFGQPERAIATYREENLRRGALISKHQDFIGPMTPFLEIGAAAGHTSYLLANEFGAQGFALDLSADALRYGAVLMERWQLERAPVRIAGDALQLPFRDGSLRLVMAFQMLSQFMDIEKVFAEVARVLAPGGIFLFAEEPVRRLLSLRLYRCPYQESMKPWERKLYEWGLLGYLVQDVVGAYQEESFGIRQNHTMYLPDWRALIDKHFVEHRLEIFPPQRGWGERVVAGLASRIDPHRATWRTMRLLGGTLTAICRKSGESAIVGFEPFEALLRCPDCHGAIDRGSDAALECRACGYRALVEHGVYNLMPSAERTELYPGDRPDLIDFSLPQHAQKLREGWYELEGVFGNKYRWIGRCASASLERVTPGPQKLRIRGHAQENSFARGEPVRIQVVVNGRQVSDNTLGRCGLFVLEAAVPDSPEYSVEILASPTWREPGGERTLSVNISMIRLVRAE